MIILQLSMYLLFCNLSVQEFSVNLETLVDIVRNDVFDFVVTTILRLRLNFLSAIWLTTIFFLWISGCCFVHHGCAVIGRWEPFQQLTVFLTLGMRWPLSFMGDCLWWLLALSGMIIRDNELWLWWAICKYWFMLAKMCLRGLQKGSLGSVKFPVVHDKLIIIYHIC